MLLLVCSAACLINHHVSTIERSIRLPLKSNGWSFGVTLKFALGIKGRGGREKITFFSLPSIIPTSRASFFTKPWLKLEDLCSLIPYFSRFLGISWLFICFSAFWLFLSKIWPKKRDFYPLFRLIWIVSAVDVQLNSQPVFFRTNKHLQMIFFRVMNYRYKTKNLPKQ